MPIGHEIASVIFAPQEWRAGGRHSVVVTVLFFAKGTPEQEPRPDGGAVEDSNSAVLPDGDQECRSRGSGAVVRDGSSDGDHRRQGPLGLAVRPPRWTRCRKLAGVLASLVAAEVGRRRVVVENLRTIHRPSGERALHAARRDQEEAFGQLNGPVFGRLSMEGILVCGKEAVFTRLLSREQARSSEGLSGFQVTVTGCQKTD